MPAVYTITQGIHTVGCKVLSGNVPTVEDSSLHSDTGHSDGNLCVTD